MWVSLLRFDPGDIVRVDRSGAFPCGRNGAVLLSCVEGRVRGLTRDGDGRPVSPGEFDRALAGEESLVAYQVGQKGRGVPLRRRSGTGLTPAISPVVG